MTAFAVFWISIFTALCYCKKETGIFLHGDVPERGDYVGGRKEISGNC